MQASTCDSLRPGVAVASTVTAMLQSEHAEGMHEHEHASKEMCDLLTALNQPFSKLEVQTYASKDIV